jgi:hypothetical protein
VLVKAIFNTPDLELRLGVGLEDMDETVGHVIFSGPLRRRKTFGYRRLDFEFLCAKETLSGAAVLPLRRHRWIASRLGENPCSRLHTASANSNGAPRVRRGRNCFSQALNAAPTA